MICSKADSAPLCVDLDGTLIKKDLLFESLARLLKQKPWLLLMVPLWCLQGRAALKRKIAQQVSIDVGCLPYNCRLLDWLRDQKSANRRLLLATATEESVAKQIADHLGIFDGVLASNGLVNPELLLQPQAAASVVPNALNLQRTAEVTNITI